jgi:ubiquinone biosynthesis protein COQ9
MGVWDLPTAMDHLLEMCHLVKQGDLMKQFTEQIMKLVQANIAVLKAALEKICNFDVVPDAIKDKIEDVIRGRKDVAGGVCDSLKKLSLRKK